jgi:hypothetical protein
MRKAVGQGLGAEQAEWAGGVREKVGRCGGQIAWDQLATSGRQKETILHHACHGIVPMFMLEQGQVIPIKRHDA